MKSGRSSGLGSVDLKSDGGAKMSADGSVRQGPGVLGGGKPDADGGVGGGSKIGSESAAKGSLDRSGTLPDQLRPVGRETLGVAKEFPQPVVAPASGLMLETARIASPKPLPALEPVAPTVKPAVITSTPKLVPLGLPTK
jgi:hypothetical protein